MGIHVLPHVAQGTQLGDRIGGYRRKDDDDDDDDDDDGDDDDDDD